jgi:type I restriction enzyme, S subunit
MAEWQTCKIKDLGKVVTGKTPPTRDAENFGGVIPFITPSDMDDRKKISSTARYVTDKGLEKVRGSAIPAYSVMVSCIGSDMGKVAINTHDAVTNQQINTIIPNKNFNADFIYYTLKPRKEELQAYATSGSAQPILNKGHFSELTIDVPPLPEQQAIAGVLSALDEKIELNRRMNATLEAMARALFKSWFVDFIPVRAKMEGRTPDGLSADLAALFPDTLAHSPLGEIPKGWEVGTIGNFCDLQNGYAFKSKDWQEDGVPVVKIGSVKPAIVDIKDVSFVSHEIAREANNFRLCEGDILIGLTGYVGTIGRIPKNNIPPLLNQRVARFTFEKSKKIWYDFLYIMARESRFQQEVERLSHGSAQANVSTKSIKGIPSVLPPERVVQSFSNIVRPNLDKILELEWENQTLSQLRDTLLPKLISGQLRVGDIDGSLKEAV